MILLQLFDLSLYLKSWDTKQRESHAERTAAERRDANSYVYMDKNRIYSNQINKLRDSDWHVYMDARLRDPLRCIYMADIFNMIITLFTCILNMVWFVFFYPFDHSNTQWSLNSFQFPAKTLHPLQSHCFAVFPEFIRSCNFHVVHVQYDQKHYPPQKQSE